MEFNAMLEAGVALTRPITDHLGTPFVVVPKGYELKDIGKLLPQPQRKRGTVTVLDSDSFIFYLKKHGENEKTTIYANIDQEPGTFNVVAVLNDDGPESGDCHWRDHRCHFLPRLSFEWSRWTGKNNKHFDQNGFAGWLEENLPDIATVEGMPTGADILKMALEFEANSDKRFRSKVNLQDGGIKLEFVDDKTNETKTTMKAFERFTLGIPVFEGSDSAYTMEARLKYREKDGNLTFWYELIRHDRVFKTAVGEELKKINKETGFPIIFGKPEFGGKPE
jgi:uncharacterized protein YfdQ (DUF2303 family)